MFPFDLSALFLVAGMVVGLIAGEAALFGDTLTLDVTVPPKIVDTGFTEATAESIFVAEAARIVQGAVVTPAPTLRVSSRPTVISALAAPLHLETVVGALQDQLGFHRLVVRASMLTGPGDSLRMEIVVNQPNETPEQIQLSQPDGDPGALVRRGANSTMERVSPYRVAQAAYTRGLDNDPAALKAARETATRYLARPWQPGRASEQVMLRNLLALLALLDNQLATAENHLRLAELMPGASPEVRGIITLNRAFLAVAAKRPTEAELLYQAGEMMAGDIDLPDFSARLMTLKALVAWSAGNVVLADEMFRAAIVDLPGVEGPHVYLARLRAAQGDEAGAAVERHAAEEVDMFDMQISVLAQSIFWVDPVMGGLKRRQ